MSKNKETGFCTVCQCYGHHEEVKLSNLSEENVFDERGVSIRTTLCRAHAVELFRFGQKKFFIKHHVKARDIISDDPRNTQFYNLMNRIGYKFLHIFEGYSL